MKARRYLLFLCSLLTVHCSLNAQQYGWTDISNTEEQGSGEAGTQRGVEVWPNPTSGVFGLRSLVFGQQSAVSSLACRQAGQQSVMIEIVNFNGKVLKSYNNRTIEQLNNGTPMFDISSLPAGIYFIRISLENQTIVKKIIKL